jgi:hypothetical protein
MLSRHPNFLNLNLTSNFPFAAAAHRGLPAALTLFLDAAWSSVSHPIPKSAVRTATFYFFLLPFDFRTLPPSALRLRRFPRQAVVRFHEGWSSEKVWLN